MGIETPATEAIYETCKALFRKDWRREARTLDNLSLKCAQLLQLSQKGKIA
ncbi:MAG: hypothetical protein GY809_10500 [Planctomycetes bacterium]|nr:hypothetical protein [Planctomycetota bacterium]